jgi:hypothetical protein
LKLAFGFQMKPFVRLVFRTTSHNVFRNCMIGGSNPVASPAAVGFPPSSVAPHPALENFFSATLPLTLT